MRPDIQRYVVDLNGDKRLRPPQEIQEVYRLAESLGRQGVQTWREMKPAHFEVFIRQIAPPVTREDDPRVTAAHKASVSASRFLGYLEENSLIDESPAWRINLDVRGSVRKFDETHPEFDGPIDDYCRAKKISGGVRGRLRAMAGHLQCSGVKYWKQVTPANIEEFARRGIERGVARGDQNFGFVQASVRSVDGFLAWAERKGIVNENPAAGLYVSGKGRLFTSRELPPRMVDTVTAYKRKVLDKQNTENTAIQHAVYLREMMLYLAGEHGVASWGSVRPAHYEQYLRASWDRWIHNPENAQMRHAACARFLDHTLTRSPADGFKLELNGRLTVPGKPKEQLPRSFTPEVAQWAGIPGVAPGFEKEANAYWSTVVERGNIGNRKRVEMVMRRFSAYATECGLKDWTEVTRDHISEYGRNLLDTYGRATANPQFSIVRTFFMDLEKRGVRKDDPSVGFRITTAGQFVEPAPVSPKLAARVSDKLHEMFPGAEAAGQRKVYRAALNPLMAHMSSLGCRSWEDLRQDTLKDYSLNVLPAHHNDPVSNIHSHRKMIRAFCEAALPNNEKNPSRGMFPTEGAGVREYQALLHPDERAGLSPYLQQKLRKPGAGEDECSLTIPALPEPFEAPLRSEKRYRPQPLASMQPD